MNDNQVPAWQVPIAELKVKVDDLRDDVRAINYKLWAGLVGIVGLLGERLMSQLDTTVPAQASSIAGLFMEVLL